MRLTQEQVLAIKSAAQTVLGEDACVTLFGSRTNDQLRGGDIDLLFETPKHLSNRVGTHGLLYVALIHSLGDCKMDVLLKDANTAEAPVMRIARETGIQL